MPAKAGGDGFVLNGDKLYVLDAHTSDFIICAARTAEGSDPANGITLFLIDTKAEGLTVELLPSMDGTRKITAVHFKDVAVKQEDVVGELNKGWTPLSRMLRRAQTALCAECVGGAALALETIVEHAKIRITFGQQLGAYQAIKHCCAQMFLEVESARSVFFWASWAQDHAEEEEAALAATVAKSYCTETYRNVTTNGIQLLGGTGFSWEHDMHLYLKRAKSNEVTLGDPFYHREQVARHLEALA